MITAQEVLLDIWKLISLSFYSIYCWLEVFYHKLFPTYKNVKDEIVLITGAGKQNTIFYMFMLIK